MGINDRMLGYWDVEFPTENKIWKGQVFRLPRFWCVSENRSISCERYISNRGEKRATEFVMFGFGWSRYRVCCYWMILQSCYLIGWEESRNILVRIGRYRGNRGNRRINVSREKIAMQFAKQFAKQFANQFAKQFAKHCYIALYVHHTYTYYNCHVPCSTTFQMKGKCSKSVRLDSIFFFK